MPCREPRRLWAILMRKVLAERAFPIKLIKFLASESC